MSRKDFLIKVKVSIVTIPTPAVISLEILYSIQEYEKQHELRHKIPAEWLTGCLKGFLNQGQSFYRNNSHFCSHLGKGLMQYSEYKKQHELRHKIPAEWLTGCLKGFLNQGQSFYRNNSHFCSHLGKGLMQYSEYKKQHELRYKIPTE